MTAPTWATLAMFATAERMAGLRQRDPVAHADLVTSMCDYRALLSQALSQDCDRNGYTLPPSPTPGPPEETEPR
jgi:hypothetical protein